MCIQSKVQISVYVCICVCVCVCVCVYVCVCVLTCVCACITSYVNTFYVCTCIPAHEPTISLVYIIILTYFERIVVHLCTHVHVYGTYVFFLLLTWY